MGSQSQQSTRKSSSNHKTNAWTPEEESLIKNLKEVQGVNNWTQIAQKVNIHKQNTSRTSKQCRQRYMNFIKFDTDHKRLRQWTSEEQQKLFILYEKTGSKWVEISKQFDMKSENSLKNKFYGSLRKLVRKLSALGREKKTLKKEMKLESLLRPLEFPVEEYAEKYQSQISLPQLRHKILKAAHNTAANIPEIEIIQLIKEINHFNWATRCRNSLLKKNISKNKPQFQSRNMQSDNIDENDEKSIERDQNKEKIPEKGKIKEVSPAIQLIDMTLFEIDKELNIEDEIEGVVGQRKDSLFFPC